MSQDFKLGLIERIKTMEKDSMFLLRLHRLWDFACVTLSGEVRYTGKKYRDHLGKELHLENPRSLTEKIQWLKLFYYEPYYRMASDKFLTRTFIKSITGKDLCPKLLLATDRANDFTLSKIHKYPCIIKVSNGCGQNIIVDNRDQYTDKQIKRMLKRMIYDANTHARYGGEKQYLPDHPFIVAEQLLQDKNGKIPDDYKFFFMNGELKFIYCSIDRFGENARHLYDAEWNRIPALLKHRADKEKYERNMASKSIEKPIKFEEMKSIGEKISAYFPLLRVDYYQVEDRVYIGELTIHHGGGYDGFYPEKYDEVFGAQLDLPKKNTH